VPEPYGDIKLQQIVRRQLESVPAPESGRAGSKIDRDVIDATRCTADELRHRRGLVLVVNASDDPTLGLRVIILDELLPDPMLGKACSMV